MIKISRFALLSLAFALATAVYGAEPNSLTAEEKAAGWQLLFDGKTTEGWTSIQGGGFPAKGWSVKDGTLYHSQNGGGGDIVTIKSYTSFELEWDWKISNAGNSGVKYNLPDPKKNIGFEYQLLDDENHPDGKRGGALHQTAGLYDLIAPVADKKMNPVGEWNHSRLVVNLGHVEHWLNGGKTVSFDMGSKEMLEAIARSKYKNTPNFGVPTASPILLQDHGDEVSFRNIKVRELSVPKP